MKIAVATILGVLTIAAACPLPSWRTGDAIGAQSLLGTISLVSDPAAASVFLDGRYVGETGPEGLLLISRKTGTCQLRVGARKYVDLVASVAFEAGRTVKLKAELAPRDQARGKSPPSVLISVGQILRGVLTEEERGRGPEAQELATDSFQFHGRQGQERNLVLHVGKGVEFIVRGPDGRKVELAKERHPPGNPPELLRGKFVVDQNGKWTILARARVADTGVPYIFGLEKAIPPAFKGKTPRGQPRLVPGVPEKSAATDGK